MGVNVQELVKKTESFAVFSTEEMVVGTSAGTACHWCGRALFRIRQLAGMERIKATAPMDLFWFRLLDTLDDPEGLIARLVPSAS